MRALLALALLGGLTFPAHATPPVDADAEAIRRTALDYIEGWYEGDPARMARALHPEMVKRIAVARDGGTFLDHMGTSKLVGLVRRGGGRDVPPERRQKDVTVLDRFENAASVKIVASGWIDYLHLVRVDGRWVIVNVLWELKPVQRAP